MNKLFPSIVIMCASLGITSSYAIEKKTEKEEVLQTVQVSDKIISQEVLDTLKEWRKEGKLTPPYLFRHSPTEPSLLPSSPYAFFPAPNYLGEYDIADWIQKKAFNEIKNLPMCDLPTDKQELEEYLKIYNFEKLENYEQHMKNIIQECRKILNRLYTSTVNQEDLNFFSGVIAKKIVMFINIEKQSETSTFSFEEIIESAFQEESEIFDKIFGASHIWYDYTNDSPDRNKTKDMAIERINVFQKLTCGLCHLVAISLMLWYHYNPDAELVLKS